MAFAFQDAANVNAGSSFSSGHFTFALHKYTGGAFGRITNGESLTLVVLEHGRARIRNDDEWSELQAHQCALYISREGVEVFCPEGSTTVSICSTARLVSPFVANSSDSTSVMHEPKTDRIATLFRLGHNVSNAVSPTQLRLRDILGEAILQSFIVESGYASDKPMPTFVRKTSAYIKDHFSEHCDLTKLASSVGVTKEHLVSSFRRHVGVTPIRYLWGLRTRHAVHLVRTEEMTLTEIANVSGYKCQFHLSREIKRLTGHTPRELRRGASAREAGAADPQGP